MDADSVDKNIKKCAQCFQTFPMGAYFQFGDRRYCKYDFEKLFQPFCAKCGILIKKHVIYALQSTWHPECLSCGKCNRLITDNVYTKCGETRQPLCHNCGAGNNEQFVAFQCHRCKNAISDPNELLFFEDNYYHAGHFACAKCEVMLTSRCGKREGQLYCEPCLPQCAGCSEPIVNERVVEAMNKFWHPKHFVCERCQKPFHGSTHVEHKGKAYCELHIQLIQGQCSFCWGEISSSEKCVFACNKYWCINCFGCFICDAMIAENEEFHEYDQRPVCIKCFKKFPRDLRKCVAKMHGNLFVLTNVLTK